MKYIIDRFEGPRTLLENENGIITAIPSHILPAGAKEGDVVELNEHGVYVVNPEETEKLKRETDDLIDDLFV